MTTISAKPPTQKDDLISLSKLAYDLQVDNETIHRAARKGLVKLVRKGLRLFKVSRDEYNRIMREGFEYYGEKKFPLKGIKLQGTK